MTTKTLELELIFKREKIRFDNSDVCILECESIQRTDVEITNTTNGHTGGDFVDSMAPTSSAVTVK